MKKKLAKLIDVKSIISITLCIVFCILSLKGDIGSEQFLTVFTMVVSFFFGYQYNKKSQESAEGAE